jgi:heat shock protein HtpX
MELCVDNPREGFTDLFATHPSVESRVQALVKYGGGHYQGPLALPMHPSDDQQERPEQSKGSQLPPPLPSGAPSGPWGSAADSAGNPRSIPDAAPNAPQGNGPWGPR